MPTFKTLSGESITTGKELGRGGEGVVYSAAEHTDIVAKIYHADSRTKEREAKLAAMVLSVPDNAVIDSENGQHVAIAWPIALLYEQGAFMGFTMPKVVNSPDIFRAIIPKLRSTHFPQLDWRHQHRIAQNLTAALIGLHAKGHVMGDINQKNVLVTANTLTTLVDCDSFQITTEQGQIFRCTVGVPEYTAPELQGKILSEVDQTIADDLFGKAVIIFQLLMEGFHPFSGVPVDKHFSIAGKMDLYCIQEGIFPFIENGQFLAPPHAPQFNVLHPDLQRLFIRCFFSGHHNPQLRPSAKEWFRALTVAYEDLVQCSTLPDHWHASHVGHCPWCKPNQGRKVPASRATPTLQQPKNNIAAPQQPQTTLLQSLQGVVMAHPLTYIGLAANLAGLSLASYIPFIWNVIAIVSALFVLLRFNNNPEFAPTERGVNWLSLAYGITQTFVTGFYLLSGLRG